MTVDPDILKELSTAVYVVTSKAQDKLNGLTVSWLTRVSLDPPLIGVAVDQRWYSNELLKKGTHFVVHILADDQLEIARHFGSSSGRDHDKLEKVDWEPSSNGVPVIRGSWAWLECRKEQQHRTGDHSLFIGKVINTNSDSNKQKLGYYREKLHA